MAVQPQHSCTYLRGMNWYTYTDLESRLFEVSKYIAFDQQNRDTWSEKLAGLQILIGSAIDSFFRDMEKCPWAHYAPSFQNVLNRINNQRNWNIHDFRDAYEPIYELSKNEIRVNFGLSSYPTLQRPFIQPFKKFSEPNGIPNWWDTYNDLKHEYYDNMKNATLDRAINALGGLLLLNILHKCSQEYLALAGLLRDEYNQVNPPYLAGELKKSQIGYKRDVSVIRPYIQTNMFHFTLRLDE